LQVDPATIPLTGDLPPVEKTRWIELFKYPRNIIAGCLTGLTQTGGVALSLWLITLFIMVLNISPGEASKLAIFVSIAAILGRFFCSWISDALGRRGAGIISCVVSALLMAGAGYLHNVFLGGVSMFFVMVLLQSFLGSGNYSIVGPYMGELWPARLRGSGMGLVYGVGNLGKFIGPAGLAWIAGSDNFVKPAATLDALVPGFLFFAYWYLIGAFAFWLIGPETRNRSIDDIDAEMNSMVTRSPEVVSAVCGIVGAAVSVAVAPFAPFALFLAVGMTVIMPSLGGVLMLVGAAAMVYVGLIAAAPGLVGILLSVITIVLVAISGIATLIAAFGKPAPAQPPATAAAQ
jgi:MFS family permease